MLQRTRSVALAEEAAADLRTASDAIDAAVLRTASAASTFAHGVVPAGAGKCCPIVEPQPAEHTAALFSWSQFPEGGDEKLQRLSEHPSFYRDVLFPLYQQLAVPGILVRSWVGGLKSFNRFARAGTVKLIEAEGGWGAFCLSPNPGYHCDVARTVRAHSKGKGSLEAIEEALAAADAAGPVAPPDLSGGFAYIAYWVQPSLVPGLKRLLAALAEEGDRIRAAKAGVVSEPVLDDPEAASTVLYGADSVPAATSAPPAPSPAWGAGAAAGGGSGVSPSWDAPVTRLASTHQSMDLLRGRSAITRDEGYLHTMRDLRAPRDTPLLQALLREGAAFLEAKAGQAPAHMAFHFPYQEMYSTLHVHVQTAVYPFSGGGSGRRLFHVRDIVEAFEAGHADIMDTAPVTFWWDKGEPEMEFFYRLAGPRWHASPEGHHHFA